MKDHLMVNVDDLSDLGPTEVIRALKNTALGAAIAQPPASVHTLLAVGESMDSEKEPLVPMVECRICQEEDNIKNLESPCACIGSLKVHITNSTFILSPLCCDNQFSVYYLTEALEGR
jgi:hypothetical protein